MMNISTWSLLFFAIAGDWTQPAEVRHDDKVVMSYRARFDGNHLVVRAAIEPGWHTFVMDNKQRQQEKLKGKPSLGIEKSTEITVEGLNVAGPWLQTEPKDFSKPELRWYSWGFERDATFAIKAKPTGSGPAKVGVQGQACSGDICKNIDLELTVPVTTGKPAATPGPDLKSLTPVRQP
jgi:hypothetical protein